MATLLDIGLFRTFSPLFAFLIVFLLTYIALSMMSAFKGKQSITITLAFLMAMIFAIYPDMTAFIYQMTPGLVFFLVFIMFVLITLSAVGLDTKDLLSLFGENNKGATWFFIIIILIIVGSAAASIFGNRLTSLTASSSDENSTTSQFKENLTKSIFNQKVIGLIVMFLVAIFAIIFLGPKKT